MLVCRAMVYKWCTNRNSQIVTHNESNRANEELCNEFSVKETLDAKRRRNQGQQHRDGRISKYYLG
jgi:hypothetical protein